MDLVQTGCANISLVFDYGYKSLAFNGRSILVISFCLMYLYPECLIIVLELVDTMFSCS